MRRAVFTLTFLALGIAAMGAEQFSGKVVSIVDGDTLDVYTGKGKPVRIRLTGIDCPERGQAFSVKAKEKAGELVHEKTVAVKVSGQDRYERTLGAVYYKNTSGETKCLNYEMVRHGLAWWYRQYAPKNQTLAKLEAEAKAAKRGLWSDPNAIPPWDFRKGISTGERDTTSGNPIVYITDTGKKYHKKTCTHAQQSPQAITLSKAKARGYGPCGWCKPPG